MDPREALRPDGKPYRILLCDDNANEVRMLSQVLEGRGYKIPETFDNGRSLVTWIRQNANEFDLVLLDIIMPTLDGFGAFWELKQLKPFPAIVFISVENSSQVVKHVLEQGALDYITRPYQRTALLDRIHTALKRTDHH